MQSATDTIVECWLRADDASTSLKNDIEKNTGHELLMKDGEPIDFVVGSIIDDVKCFKPPENPQFVLYLFRVKIGRAYIMPKEEKSKKGSKKGLNRSNSSQ